MILKLLGFNIAPILGGLGILGIAVGFGAQSLIKDFIAGIFMLLENQYGVGDDIEILVPRGSRGRVLKVTIRSTVLKDKKGKINYISNGSITNVVNYSKSSIDHGSGTNKKIKKNRRK
jgi:small conductance mechanosensitive channel